jgi:putative ABC transport system permease protein
MESRASFMEAVTVAAGSLRSAKLRTFLTLLGIILATTTLISVMSVINGMDRYIAENVSDMGVDGFQVSRIPLMGQRDPKKWLELQKRNPQLRREEFEFLKSRLTMVREFGMEAYRSAPVYYGTEKLESVDVQGATANIALMLDFQPAAGRFLIEAEDVKRQAVAFIGADLKQRFFPSTDPVGKTLRIQGRPFEVIGVSKAKGSVFGQTQDQFVVIPMGTFEKMYSGRLGVSYRGLALDRGHMERAQDEVRMLIRAFRHLRPSQDDNFGLMASESLQSLWDQLTGAIAATAVAVVSVFMVVGGVVIMNIMLAVVTERTHEIGIRKSVGASRPDILKQFLVESCMMAGTGGLVGVLIAWLVAVVVRTATPVPMAVPASAVFIGVTLSTAVGLFFGIYPAQRAAKMDPIEALRAEK